MNVKNLKEVAPLTEAYEFREDGKYFVAVSIDHFHAEVREKLGKMVPANAIVMGVADDPHDAMALAEICYFLRPFEEATILLTGQTWTAEQADELHRLINEGTAPGAPV